MFSDAAVFTDSGAAVAPDCPVCLSVLTESEELCFCTCTSKHVFHAACVKPWVAQHKSCPVCRGRSAKTRPYFLPVLIDLLSPPVSPSSPCVDLCTPEAVLDETTPVSKPSCSDGAPHALLKLRTCKSRRQRCSLCSRLFKRVTRKCATCGQRFCFRCKKT